MLPLTKEPEAIFTYSEWQRIHARTEAKRKAKRNYFIKQKLAGLSLVIIGIIITVISKDATAGLFIIPIGIGLTVTRQKVMDFK